MVAIRKVLDAFRMCFVLLWRSRHQADSPSARCSPLIYPALIRVFIVHYLFTCVIL